MSSARKRWLALLGVLLCALVCATAPAHAQDEVVVEEEVVAEDDVAADEAPAPAEPALIEARTVAGETFWQRQSSDAFVDPDARLDLVPKYVFALPEQPLDELLDQPRGPALATGQGLIIPDQKESDIPWPGRISPAGQLSSSALAWLDYLDGDKSRWLAILDVPPAGQPARQVALVVARAARGETSWAVQKVVAVRELATGTLPAAIPPAMLWDVYDRPLELAARRELVGRVIAVLRRIEGRHAVDFFGDSLNPESDCRLWIASPGPSWWPIAVRFIKLPIKRDTGRIAQVDVLAVAYREEGSGPARILAYDFPICATPVLKQMRALADRLASQKKKPGEANPANDQATALLGEDLADELARRLVNGLYHPLGK